MTSSLQGQEPKLIYLLVDHTNFLPSLRSDAIVQNQAPLTPVMSPKKLVKRRRYRRS
jgi:hypothetical protein